MPDRLLLYSPHLRLLRELDLPAAHEREAWGAAPSPADRYLLMFYEPRTNEDVGFTGAVRRWELIDTGSLRLIRGWTEKGFGVMHPIAPLNDTSILAVDGKTDGVADIGPPPDGPWQRFQARWESGCRPAGLMIPVNGRTIFGGTSVSIDKWCYSLTTTDGTVLFEQQFASNLFIGKVAVSAGGHRFAVESYKVHGGSWLLDIGGHASVYRIKVYDLRTRQWVYSLDGKKQRIKSVSGLALSPDGSLLALIDQSGILRVYHVPQK